MRQPPRPPLKTLPGALGAQRGGAAPIAIRLLLVEDSPEHALLVREMLAAVWFVVPIEVHTVDHLASALDRISAGHVDAILLDLTLPDASGLDMIARVRAVAPSIPMIVLTGRDDDELAVEALHRGAQDYLVKGQQDATGLARSIRNAVERKRTQESLRTSEETFRTLIEYAPDCVFVHRGGRIVYVNQAVLACLRFRSTDEVVGRLLMDVIHPEDRRYASERMREVTEDWHRVPPREFRLLRRDGAIVWAEIIAQPCAFRGEPAVVAFARDVTERRRRIAKEPTLDPDEEVDPDAPAVDDSDSDDDEGGGRFDA